MKAVILAGGKGQRIVKVTGGENKCLLEVHKKPIILYHIEHLLEIDEITECIIVVGYHAEEVMRVVGNSYGNKRITYCFQKEQKGLIHALECAKYAIGNEDFFMVLGDEYVVGNHYRQAIRDFKSLGVACMIGVIEADNIEQVKKTYTFRSEENGRIYDFIEKPKHPYNRMMGTGNVIMRADVMERLCEIPVNTVRGERDLVDLFNLLKSEISYFYVGARYINVNTQEDLERAEQE